MANVVITRGNTVPDTYYKADIHNLVDQASATVSNIVNADIDSAAAIADTKLAQITTASKVSGSAITSLTSVPSGAGVIPGANLGTGQVEFIFGNGVTTITTGIQGDIRFPYACTITQVDLLADQTGSIVVDLWKDTYANYPATVADTITAAAKPTISSATKATDSTLTGWTTSVAAGDIIRVNVDSVTTCTRVALVIKFTRT